MTKMYGQLRNTSKILVNTSKSKYRKNPKVDTLHSELQGQLYTLQTSNN